MNLYPRHNDQPVPTAAYLRCYPFDRWGMASHRWALEDLAVQLGLPTPVLYLDNGYHGRAVGPHLQRLQQAIANQRFTTLLIPGPWVFHLDDARARQTVLHLVTLGCTVFEMPDNWTREPMAHRPHPESAQGNEQKDRMAAA
ncbi:hypothetical protein [Streptacidiphilus sp. PAMC 29251]